MAKEPSLTTSSSQTLEDERSLPARVLANPWRARIIGELYLRPMSATQFMREFGGDRSTISRHFRLLLGWGYIEQVEERRGGPRRGGVERIYRTVRRDLLDTEERARLSPAERQRESANSIAFYFRQVEEAVRAETFDADLDRQFSWDTVALDRTAWTELLGRLSEILAWLPELEVASAQRLRESGEEPIPTTVGLAGFRSPTRAQRKALDKALAGGRGGEA